MAAGDTHVADLVDSVRHEMDSAVCGHHVYKSVWLAVIERLVLQKNPAGQSTWWIAVSGTDKGFSDIWVHFVGSLFTDHVVLYYTKGLSSAVCRLILLGEGGKEKS